MRRSTGSSKRGSAGSNQNIGASPNSAEVQLLLFFSLKCQRLDELEEMFDQNLPSDAVMALLLVT